ncbi:MAG TPA: nucleoside 2-deoxyribosyltransferase [Vitreimonas sp.]|nr:nucleoside 2-deoxyribosyltransferase [Vitreimonas sp.]
MKTYFVGSISGRDKYLKQYEAIVNTLKKLEYTVVEDTLRPSHDEVYGLSDQEKVSFYKQVLKWISGSDIVVAEASHPSLGVGHEIAVALERGKPVIVLYTEGHAPHFLEGLDSEKLVVQKYSLENLEETLKSAIDFAISQADTRFNFFISPRQVAYLDFIAKTKKIPRSVYLRNLIEADREKNWSEYEAA